MLFTLLYFHKTLEKFELNFILLCPHSPLIEANGRCCISVSSERANDTLLSHAYTENGKSFILLSDQKLHLKQETDLNWDI